MKTFKEFLSRKDENMFRWLQGTPLPKDMTPEERQEYDNLRKGMIGHEEALKMALRNRASAIRPKPSAGQVDWERSYR